MSSSTSIGRGPSAGGNENHDGDPGNKTMGESVQAEPPAGSAAAESPMPDGPNVGPSSWEVDAAKGKLPPK